MFLSLVLFQITRSGDTFSLSLYLSIYLSIFLSIYLCLYPSTVYVYIGLRKKALQKSNGGGMDHYMDPGGWGGEGNRIVSP